MKKEDLDILKTVKKKLREDELKSEMGWKQQTKIIKSKKNYTRKQKHKK